MPVDPMFILATATFAWGLSLATYRWFAVHNGWPMGEWQSHRPGLPIAIGLFAVLFAVIFGIARGGATAVIVPLLGVLCALAWTALTRIGAQIALLLAPVSVLALLGLWILAVNVADTRALQPTLEREPIVRREFSPDPARVQPVDNRPIVLPPLTPR